MKAHHETQSNLSEINVTPLVDVMLVLLIIFMVTAPLLQQGFKVHAPEVNAESAAANKDDVTLSIAMDRSIYLGEDDKTQYSMLTIEDKLRAIFENREKKILYVKADKELPYGVVAEIMDVSRRAGVEDLVMVTIPKQTIKNK